MPQRHMPQLMGNHTGHFFRRNLTRLIFLEKPARDENPPVRGRQPVHRLNFIDMHLHTFQIERTGHAIAHLAQGSIRQFG